VRFTIEENMETENFSPKILIVATTSREVSFAGHQNSIPLIRELSVINETDEELQDLVLSMEVSPDFVSPKKWNITSLEAKGELALRDRDTKLNAKFLLELIEPMKGDVSFVLKSGDEEIARKDVNVRLLARNEWGGIYSQPELLAAFAMPNDPAVDRIISSAIDVLRRSGKNDVLDGYATKDRDHVWRQVSAVWSAVSSMNIKYHIPPASFEKVGQKIRLPTNIAKNSISTCLDTTMLFCSALEQIGMHSFVVVTKGHALAGVWLQPDMFSTLPMEDISTLRKRKDLNELILFETTLSTQEPPSTFGRAVKEGANRINEELEDEFELVIDIQRARDRQIQPLSLMEKEKTEENNETNSISILPLDEPESTLGTFSSDAEENQDDKQLDRIDVWQRKLLDLTLRNPLLNFKATQTNIPVICPNPGLLEDILATGKKISIAAMPDLTEGSGRDNDIHVGRTGRDLVDEHALRGLQGGRAEIYVKDEKSKLENRLINLYRKAKNDLEEGGTNTLFLAIGTLSYVKEDRKGRVFKAPLILVPVELNRKSVRSGVKLSLHDDEPRFNTTLLEMLKEDFNLNIPGLDGRLPEDESGIDVAKVWNIVRKNVVDIEGFEVKEEVFLGTFSFAKFLMWKDLVDRTDMLRDNPVVRHLIDRDSGEAYSNNIETFEPKDLDEELDPKNLFTPLPADSSQLSAVMAADMGQDFVIIGPPGSGKSQTISNMISQLLANKKKVLFVSEKAAALNVVYRRLKDVGLSEFCLELHSNKAKKLDVLSQFNSAWSAAETLSKADWEKEADKIKSLRDQLNQYVQELHKMHKNGLTVHRAIGEVVKHSDLPKIALSYPSADQHSSEELEEIRSVIHDMKVNAEVLEELRDHPLSVIETFDWSNAWQNKIAKTAKELLGDTIRLETHLSKVHETLKIEKVDLSLDKIMALTNLASSLIVAGKFDVSFALEGNAEDVLQAMFNLKDHLTVYIAESAKLSVSYKDRPWKSIDIEEYKSRLSQANQSWWPKSVLSKNTIRKNFMFQSGAYAKPNLEADLALFEKMKTTGNEIERLGEIVKGTKIWKGYQTSNEAIDQHLAMAKKLIAAINRVAGTTDELITLKTYLKGLLGAGRELLEEGASVGIVLRNFVEDSTRFDTTFEAFSTDASRTKEDITSVYSEGLKGVEKTCRHILDNQSKLNSWCAWQGIKRKSVQLGLAPVVEAFEDGLVSIDRLEDLAETAYCRWWGSLKIDASDALRGFNSRSHADSIKQFQEIDDRYRKLSANYARAMICGSLPDKENVARNSEEGKIRRILGQTRPRKTVRAMIEESPNFITELTPCVLMSPLSIAQYLPADFKAFDVVIFDEASQITVWDAIGSIARAKQTVIAGDPKQMPPSNGFGRGESDTDSDNDDEKDLESILDEMLSAGIPQRYLNWHYRSRHESLITFSNHQYYEGNLITFPSPSTEDKAVSLVRVNGVYALGNGRTNIIEARAVVAKVVEKLLDSDFNNRGLSIGVVTFNTEQQQLILNLLDKERKTNNLIEKHFSDENLEPVFVKNLESVQGDERDIIMFSLTFGKKAEGARMSMNFGPMNKVGGERRLNVAITRAREEMIVFSSFDADEIDLSRTSAVGVNHLKHFVDYAARGTKAISERNAGSVGGFDSPFEESVAALLQKKGWTILPQIGVSAFRIDIGVVHPDYPGAYLVGIECDGATYHSSATARDRDKVRESVLNGLGWSLIRIWSTDFWNDADGEIERVDEEIKSLLALNRKERSLKNKEAAEIPTETSQTDLNDDEAINKVEELVFDTKGTKNAEAQQTELADTQSAQETGRPAKEEIMIASNAAAARPPLNYNHGEYRIFSRDDTDLTLDPEKFYEDGYRQTLHKLIREIVSKEAPISTSELIHRVSRLHGFARSGATIRKLLQGMIMQACNVVTEEDNHFVWPIGMQPDQWHWARKHADEASKRDVNDIAMEELVSFVREYSADPYSIDAVRKALGYARLSGAKKFRIERAMEIATQNHAEV
jgi:Protein of unknown function (DUF4011)/REase_MTES_1575/AAA domain/Protein of unknown function (DUF3320)